MPSRCQYWKRRVLPLYRAPPMVGTPGAEAAFRRSILKVPEALITPEMMDRASRLEGLDVGPEGAACLLALENLRAADHVVPGQRVVVFQTGHPANYREP